MSFLRVAQVGLLSLFAGVPASADWPQWMGPGRDNVVSGLQLPGSLESSPPKVVWRTPTAGGYSGPAVADGRVFLTDYETGDNVDVPNFERQKFSGVERVRCLDADLGELLWQQTYPVDYTISYPAGPRCTPTVDGDRVYTLGAQGRLLCLDVADGEIVWSRELTDDYATKAALWGYASHPLVDGDKLICVVGGSGSQLVAFDKRTGEEIWKQGDAPEQGYVPPKIVRVGKSRQLVTADPASVSGLDPETGRVIWSVPYQATSGSVIMSPLVTTIDGSQYLYMAGYSNKNLLLKFGSDGKSVEVVFQDLFGEALSPVNVQPLVRGDVLYGFDQKGLLIAASLPSGERLWETSRPLTEKRPLQTGTAFIVSLGTDDRYLMFTETGDLVRARLTPDGFTEIDRTHLIEPTGTAFGRKVVWSAPAYAGTQIYVRNDKEIVCFDLSPNPAAAAR